MDIEPPEGELVGSLATTADAEGLQRCTDLAEQVCEAIAAPPGVAYAVNLAVEEVCVNVVNHAYAGGPPGPIELEFRVAREPAPARLSIVVRDRAPFFDPDQAPPPDLDADIDERRIGGLGWFLVRETMDAVSHAARPDGGNVVTMVKSMADAAAGDAP